MLIKFTTSIALVLMLVFSTSLEAGQNVWTSQGPDAEIISLAIDPSTPTTIYAGSNESGVFKSVDGGASWVAMNDGLTDLTVQALAIDPSVPTTIYAGSFSRGVFQSVDGGVSWNRMSIGLPNASVQAVEIDPATPETLYAGTGGGVYKSVDGAQFWTPANNGLPGAAVISMAIDTSTPTTLYAGTTGGLFKSVDGGVSWASINMGLDNDVILNFAVDPNSSTTIYAGTNISPGAGGLFKSVDGGLSWNITALMDLPISALALEPSVPTTIYATPFSGVEKSTDGGASFIAMNTGLTNSSVRVLEVNPVDPEILYAGTSAGVFEFTRSAAVTVVPTEGLRTSESGLTDTFSVVLTSAPAASVVIDLSSSDPSEGSVAPTAVTFVPADALTPQTVTVTGVDDSLVDGSVAYRVVTAPAASADPEYNLLDAEDVQVINRDNDGDIDLPTIPTLAPLGQLSMILLLLAIGWTYVLRGRNGQ